MQKKLDEKILERFPELKNEDLLPQKILSLQVELGELCQNWRGFKFWSKDQASRTFEWFGKCEECDGYGDDENSSCPDCAGTGVGHCNPLLEEYVDGLHFILSIGNDLGVDLNKCEIEAFKNDTILDQFNLLFYVIGDLKEVKNKVSLIIIMEYYLGLGGLLGFSWEQITDAYYAKNAINHTRQDNSY